MPTDLALPDLGERDGRGPAFRGERVGRVYATILAAILDHRLPPGTRLPEDEVGALFGASRTIVRAALQELAHEKVVTIEPNCGAQVAEPTTDEARQVFEARSLIEPRVAALAAGRATKPDVVRLRAHHAEEEAAIVAGDQGKAIALSAHFHTLIAAIADQPILEAFVRELTSRSSLVVALYWRRRDATCERHAHHELIEAIATGAADRAADLMRSHLVDILSGLDLTHRGRPESTLSDLLRPRPQGRS